MTHFARYLIAAVVCCGPLIAQPIEFRGASIPVYKWNERVSISASAPISAILFASGMAKIYTPDTTFYGRVLEGRFVTLEAIAIDSEESDPVSLSQPMGGGGVCNDNQTCGYVEVDVLIVYSNQVGDAYPNIEQEGADAVDEMNMALELSGADHRMRLVGVRHVDYNESGSITNDLQQMKAGTALESARRMREEHRADILSLIASSGGCGVAFTQNDPNGLNESLAMNVMSRNCMISHLSLAHEIGHSMGLHHDWYTTTTQLPCPWHKGYVNEAVMTDSLLEMTQLDRWVTIMAYTSPCSRYGYGPCHRTWHYSNPDLLIRGYVAGVDIGKDRPANSVYALNRTMCAAALFRDGPLAIKVTEELPSRSGLHPNPFSGHISGSGSIEVYDIRGALLLKGALFVDTSNLPPGAYLVRSSDEHKVMIKR